MKPTILMVPHMPQRVVDKLAERYTVLGPMERSAPDALPPGAEQAEVLLTYGGLPTGAALIDALPKLRLISCFGTGIEGVDQAHAKARGILLSNAADANAASVAEFAMGLLLSVARLIGTGDRFVRAGKWQRNVGERLPFVPGLAGRRLGIYGLGAIGARIAHLAAAFGMEIGYHGRSQRPDTPYLYHDSLVGLAGWADILVVAVRANADTRHTVDSKVLQALGPQGQLINISRGLVIDEEALCTALETGVIAGAGLDVFENEPDVPERLRRLENVVLTPHIAANTLAAQSAQLELFLGNLEAFFSGRPLLSPVVS